jgi:single-stranded-DNA-specific exonuclease
MKKRVWRIEPVDIEKSTRLAVRLGISQLVAQLLVNRGIETEEAARAYLHPTAQDLHHPFLMPDMDKAVERIQTAMKRGERIWIYGDYDTDGTTAVALLLCTFRHLGYPVEWYIPNRFEEGYGLNKEAIGSLSKSGCDLLITVDCGITAIEEVELADARGMDVIITDHHQPRPDAWPPAYAMITPKMPGSEYPFHGLAGVGLAFKLAHALMGGGELNSFLQSQLDLVVLGTVVDIASLRGENRVLTKLGLVEINKRERPGIRALCEVARLSVGQPIGGHTLSFVLGPRINAAGRMDTARKVVELFTEESYEAAIGIAQTIDAHNQARREEEQRIADQAIDSIKKDVNLEKTKGLVVANEGWHRGVVGIVASRVLEYFHRPVFLLAIEGDEAHGSGRSIEGINLAASLNACAELLIKHGGHEAAAGLTIKTANISEFKRRFNEYACERLTEEDLAPKLRIDLEVESPYLTLEAVEELNLLEPFGADNKEPLLAVRNLSLQRPPGLMGKAKNHLKLFVTDGHQTLEAIGWGMAEYHIALQNKNIRLDLAFEPEINKWNNNRRVQLKIKDLHIQSIDRHEVQAVFPAMDRESPVRIVDRRNTRSKPNYICKVLDRGEPALLYVRDDKALDQLFALISPNVKVGRCDAQTSDAEKQALADRLDKGDLLAIASSCTLMQPSNVEHMVFCHPVPDPSTFFSRCQLAFKRPETTYIHLTYNQRDVEWMLRCLSWEYPDEELLRNLYKQLHTFSQQRKLSHREVVAAAQTDSVPEAAIINGLKILAELQLLVQSAGEIQLLRLPSEKRQLYESETYLKGEQIKQTASRFSDFQLKQDIQEIWKRISYECRMPH